MAVNLKAPAVDAVVDQWCQVMQALHSWRPGQQRPLFDSHVTLPQLKAIGLLGARPTGLSGRELAALLGVGPSAVTPLADRLVEHGWARREEDRADRRITRLFITEGGQALLERMVAGQRELIASALRQLDADELAIVERALSLLREGARRAGTSPGAPAELGGPCTANIQPGAADTGAGERISLV